MTPSNPAVWPTLQAHDAPALIDYLVETLGFVVTARYGDGDRVDHAQLNWPEGTGGLMMGSHKPGTDWCREPGSAGAYIVTADADELHARVTAKNADIVRSVYTTDYGSREFAVRDPEGNLWSFGSYTGELPRS
ncbi:VOC family protein [Mycolicibacterium sp. 050158]|uniref:VOC family protein n=1 Tax=Mycolicibacterium sp. 050158 TaxID=3090602 RepID=UPI00299E57DE|nr:VOC family protein [Mycolicibacterium sp. 050158]MDX1893083.1 VOC family protein [Mycolicibacterium sp. 050158]